MQIAFQRILLKLSGEALAGNDQFGIDPRILDRIAAEIQDLHKLGVEIGLVIGGGNLFRGAQLSAAGLGRISADHMGMLATVMNAIALRDALERLNVPTKIMSAIPMTGVVDHYDRRKAMYHLSKQRVVIFAGGLGNPLFTTDSAACLRGIEVEANIVLKATQVDGIYSADPRRVPTAQRYEQLTYDEVVARNLEVMDLTAILLCRDHGMKLRVFNLGHNGALRRIVMGESIGTLVT